MKTLVIAPHADDELLGCGGTLLRRRAEGATVGWVLVGAASEHLGWSRPDIEERARQIVRIRQGLGIAPQDLQEFGFPAAQLGQVPMDILVGRLAEVFKKFQPREVLVPHPGDAHGDHRIVFEAASACAKWFRCPSVQRVLAYETLSETDAGLEPSRKFSPTVFVDVTPYLEQKIQLLSIYDGEVGAFPFPRSAEAVRALATLRGAGSGYHAAEAYELLRERL